MRIEFQWSEVDSSFITSIAWLPREESEGVCLINIRGTVYCYVAPPWAYGLLQSAITRGVSVGRIYSRIFRGRFERAELTPTEEELIHAC